MDNVDAKGMRGDVDDTARVTEAEKELKMQETVMEQLINQIEVL